jgi:hypothetical protein
MCLFTPQLPQGGVKSYTYKVPLGGFRGNKKIFRIVDFGFGDRKSAIANSHFNNLQSMRILLISNSTNAGKSYLDYQKFRIREFPGAKRVKALFIPKNIPPAEPGEHDNRSFLIE